MEIVCDILLVIHEGSARPTQVMHRANLTWPVLMTHLEALLRHELLTRESSATRTTYRLTAKGSAILKVYLELKEGIGPLENETFLATRLREPEQPTPASMEKRATLFVMQSVLQGASLRVRERSVTGKSGAKYRFDLLAEGPDKSLYGFDVIANANEGEVIRVFVKQLDSDISVSIVYTDSASDAAKKLARSYSMELVHARDFEGFARSTAFRSVLLLNKGGA
jgi:predicted transcriptional regulator